MKSTLSVVLCAPKRLVLAGAVTAVVTAAYAAPPLIPLPRPFYSFDRESPTVLAGFVGAADVLALGPGGPFVVVPGINLGLGAVDDDLDSLTGSHRLWPPGQPFAILFSVDRQTQGVAPPDPGLVAMGVPFNVRDQVERGHAAGDQFMSLTVFTAGGTLEANRDRAPNSTQVGNNYDEGGTSFGGQPPTSSSGVTGPVAQDDLDATASASTALRDFPTHVYFSATSESPSLVPLSIGGPPSGANIFFNPAPLDFAPSTVFARYSQLQLTQLDDIDGMVVFDFNNDGVYNPGDIVLFSLAPGSPRLSTIPGHSQFGAAADIFVARPGAPTTTLVQAATLGLGHPLDNIDALEILPCQDGVACAHEYGIRLKRGDMDCDGDVDFFDIDPLVLAFSGPDAYAAVFPSCFWHAGDCNCDGVVNFFDIDPFVACLGGNCQCQ